MSIILGVGKPASSHGPGEIGGSLHLILKHETERELRMLWCVEISKPTPSDTPPVKRSNL